MAYRLGKTTPKGKHFFTKARLGWALYDSANSAFVLSLITVIGPAYFVAAFNAGAKPSGLTHGGAPALNFGAGLLNAETAWSFFVSASALLSVLSMLLFSTMADSRAWHKRILLAHCLGGALLTVLLGVGFWSWVWVGCLIMLANVGYEGGNVQYNAFLPALCSNPKDQDRLSGWGYAFGYVGGVLVLLIALVFFTPPSGDIRHTFWLVGAWWGLLGTWCIARLPHLEGNQHPMLPAIWKNLTRLKQRPHTLRFLLAFLLYNDGVATFIANTTPYVLQNIYTTAQHIQLVGLKELIPVIIMIQLIAAPGTLLFSWLARHYGAKATLLVTIAWFSLVTLLVQVISTLGGLYVLAAMVGLVLGGIQSLSRAMYASFSPAQHHAEHFSLFALSGKFSSVFGPLVYGQLLLLSGSSKLAILSLNLFFLTGALLLLAVDLNQARGEAQITA